MKNRSTERTLMIEMKTKQASNDLDACLLKLVHVP